MYYYKIGIVILHYQATDVTMNCIESVKKHIGYPNYVIIVVDNASPNQSGQVLLNTFREDDKVSVICNEQNLGFSKGNNIGYRYAKEVLKCDFIILSNNDIKFISDEIGKVLTEDFEKYHYAVLGPDIKPAEPGSDNVNPYHKIELSEMQMKSTLSRMRTDLKIAIILSYIGLDRLYFKIRRIPGRIIHSVPIHTEKNSDKTENNNKIFDTGLHGCFWIFSPLYVTRFDGLQEITFMYYEEWLLYNQMKHHKLLMMYEPEIQVFHAEKIATKQAVGARKLNGIRGKYRRELDSIACVMTYINNSKPNL